MEIKMLGTGCTLAAQWIATLWFSLSSWAFLLGNLRSCDRHRWILQEGHFWQSVINFLTYGTCLFFSSKFGDDVSLVYFGFSLIRFSRIAREDCRKSFEWHFSTFSEPWRILLPGLLEDGLFSWQVVWPPQSSLGFRLSDLKCTVEYCHKKGSSLGLIPNGAAKTTAPFWSLNSKPFTVVILLTAYSRTRIFFLSKSFMLRMLFWCLAYMSRFGTLVYLIISTFPSYQLCVCISHQSSSLQNLVSPG